MSTAEGPNPQTQNHGFFSIVPKRIWFILTLGVCLLRFFLYYDYKPLWIDEQASVNAACGDSTLKPYSFEELQTVRANHIAAGHFVSKIFWADLQNDRGNALLYDYSLSAWFLLFGVNLLAAKAFSFFCFLLVVCFSWRFAKLLSFNSGFLVLLLLANSLLFRYSLECRTYMFTTLLSLLSTWIYFSYLRTSKLSLLLLYALLILASLFSHYLVLIVFAWHYVLLWFRANPVQKKTLMLTYILCAVMISGLLYLLNHETGFMARLGAANNNISSNAPTSVHYRPFSVPNLITGWIQILSQNFGVSLQSFLQIRFFAFLLLIPFYFVFKNFIQKGAASLTEFFALVAIHLLFTGTVSRISGNCTIFSLAYSIFVLPYYLVYFSGFSKEAEGEKPVMVFALKGLTILAGLIDTALYIFLV